VGGAHGLHQEVCDVGVAHFAYREVRDIDLPALAKKASISTRENAQASMRATTWRGSL